MLFLRVRCSATCAGATRCSGDVTLVFAAVHAALLRRRGPAHQRRRPAHLGERHHADRLLAQPYLTVRLGRPAAARAALARPPGSWSPSRGPAGR